MASEISDKDKRHVLCPVCGNSEVAVLCDYVYHSRLFSKMELVECTSCRLVFADPLPAAGELHTYNRDYFQNAHGGAEVGEQAVLFFRGIAALRLQHVEHYVADMGTAVRAVLEIGPGSGHFAAHFLRRHPEASYTVVESDQTCHTVLSSLNVMAYRDLSELAGKGPVYDLLVMSHVLEHLANPPDLLGILVGLLRPGGVVFIEVPCRDHEFKAEHEPHLLFFDMPAMARLLEDRGLTSIRLSYHGKSHDQLKRSASLPAKVIAAAETLLHRRGIIAPWLRSGLPTPSLIEDLRIWAAVKPYLAHLVNSRPSWWLRALATKP